MRENLILRPIKLNVLFKKGGLGDTIARLPSVNYILDTSPHIEEVRLVVQDYATDYCSEVLKKYGSRIKVFGLKDLDEVLSEKGIPGMMTDSNHHTTLRSHLTDHAFHTIVDVQLKEEDVRYKNYLIPEDLECFKVDGLPEKYVVITTGFTAAVREWIPSSINKVVEYIINTLKYEVVFLGKRQNFFWGEQGITEGTFRQEIDFSKGIDLRDSTTLLEASYILSKASAVVGVDNGLLHLAAASNPEVPIIAGFTSVDPEHRLPYRRDKKGYKCLTVVPKIACKFCQTKLHFLYNFDFRNCFYKDFKCRQELTVEDFCDKIDIVLVGDF
jgi:hypothetical protein